ncbi:MAG: hypothetical protein CBB68_02865 [Rhodospirillaceae bacterium TMED8]|nr:hypothetical protein [Magnetovibrio sp.]OUT52311.1 MAG: hypothetical protein CBB68_02865 [Rhodospirillaceae bacterium TMED8]|tara:strand:- start:69 stop:950 length:882 start_codon:yes stop_codon:yes gene_type:complete
MTPTQARAFFAVAKAGTFSGAARQLNVSQPTLTVQVKELELTYGVDLFVRDSTGARLTEVGAALFPLAEKSHLAEEDCKNFLQKIRSFERGQLIIGSAGPIEAMRVAALLRQHHGSITISVVFANTRELIESLRSGSIDVALVSGATYTSDIEHFAYIRNRLVAVAPDQPQWSNRAMISSKELHTHSLIIREQGSIARDFLERTIPETIGDFSPSMIVGSREGVIVAVEQGLGIGVICEAGFLKSSNVQFLKIIDFDVPLTMDVACLKGRQENKLIKKVMDIAKKDANKEHQS